MKKNLKIALLSAIATLGVAATFGSAFALYVNSANSDEFSIGTYTHTSGGTVTYEIGDVTSDLGDNKISPDHTSVIFKAPLGGHYSEDIAAQDFVYGNLKVDLTIPEGLKSTTRWCVYVDGYNPGSYWDARFESLRRLTGDKPDEKDPFVGTCTVNKDIAVNAKTNPTVTDYTLVDEVKQNAENQWVVVYLDFSDSITESSFLQYAEGSFKIDITFSGVSETCSRPVIVGDYNDWNKNALEYAMVPNIAKEDGEYNWQWEYKGLTGFSKLIIRVKVDGTDLGDYYVKSLSEGDLDVNPETTYEVYIGGVSGNRNSLYTELYEAKNYIRE